MKKGKTKREDATALRRQAEARSFAAPSSPSPSDSPEDHQRLVHELHVHQIELEMQNEELRRSRAEVEAGLERYTDLYDDAPVGYLTLNHEGKVLQANLTGAKLVGAERGQLLGRHLGMFIAPADRIAFNAFLQKVFAGEALEHCPAKLPREGSPLVVNLQARRSPGGRECRVILLDITQRTLAETQQRQLEAQLHQAQKMEAVGLLASGIAHDFRNQLNIISSIGNVLLDNKQVSPEAVPMLAQLLDAASRSAHLTGQLLSFARKQPLQPQVVDLGELVANSKAMLHHVLGEDILIVLDRGTAPLFVKIDPHQLEHALLNLCSNSRDAMSHGGRLTLNLDDLTPDDAFRQRHPELSAYTFVRLAVTDTGCGMNAATCARAFEPFFTTKAPGRNSGLGLAMVHGFVAQSGGCIEVASTPDIGTTFSLYFPATTGVPASPHAPPHATTRTPRPQNILLVEDEPGLLFVTGLILEQAGYRPIPAATPRIALTILADLSQPIDLLLTDVIMPDMSGVALAEQAGNLRQGLPVLFVSGYAKQDLIDRGLKIEHATLLEKPCPPPELLRTIHHLLHRDALR